MRNILPDLSNNGNQRNAQIEKERDGNRKGKGIRGSTRTSLIFMMFNFWLHYKEISHCELPLPIELKVCHFFQSFFLAQF